MFACLEQCVAKSRRNVFEFPSSFVLPNLKILNLLCRKKNAFLASQAVTRKVTAVCPRDPCSEICRFMAPCKTIGTVVIFQMCCFNARKSSYKPCACVFHSDVCFASGSLSYACTCDFHFCTFDCPSRPFHGVKWGVLQSEMIKSSLLITNAILHAAITLGTMATEFSYGRLDSQNSREKWWLQKIDNSRNENYNLLAVLYWNDGGLSADIPEGKDEKMSSIQTNA